MPDAKITTHVPRPAETEINRRIDDLLKGRDAEFAAAYQEIVRKKNKAIWQAGFEAGVAATLAVKNSSS